MRGFSNGSVVVNFGALLRPASTVTEGDLESVATTVLEATHGSIPGTDIVVDPTATAFTGETGHVLTLLFLCVYLFPSGRFIFVVFFVCLSVYYVAHSKAGVDLSCFEIKV